MGYQQMQSVVILVMLMMLSGIGAGCRSGSGPMVSPYEHDIGKTPVRDTATAQRLSQEGAAKMETDPEAAEELFRRALQADLFWGPAHNNLGVLFLNANPARLYEAAGEFEWACRLMPGHPDPRMNLAMTLESAGRSDDAIAAYRTALEMYPGHMPTLQALTSLQLRTARSDEATRNALKDIALAGTDPSWRMWARQQMLKVKVP